MDEFLQSENYNPDRLGLEPLLRAVWFPIRLPERSVFVDKRPSQLISNFGGGRFARVEFSAIAQRPLFRPRVERETRRYS